MPYTTLTAGDYKTALLQRIGGNTAYWSAAERLNSINESLEVWQAMTGDFTNTVTFSITSGVNFYDTPFTLASVLRVTFGTSTLTKTSLEELDLGIPSWQTAAAGTPTFWFPMGINMFGIYPTASGSVDLWGLKESPVLVNDADTVDLPGADLAPFLDYEHHYLEFKEGGAEFQATQDEFKAFVTAAALRNSQIIATSTYQRFMGGNHDEHMRKPRSPVQTLGGRS